MEILNKLSPAEAHLIRANTDAQLKDLLKFTFSDLLLKKVLKSIEHDHQSHPSLPIRSSIYIGIGQNFDGYNGKAHERVYLQPFIKNRELEISFKDIVKIGFDNAGSKKSYIFDRLYKNNEIQDSVKNGFLNRLFVKVNLTKEGLNKKIIIDKAIQQLEVELPQLIESRPNEASQILKQINGNIYLLNSFDFEILKKIDSELSAEMKRQRERDESGCSGCSIYYDTYLDAFDIAIDYTDSGSSGCDASSGCSTYSGCNACSGCSGCGGCSS